ncbi:hypothetical protein [Pseudomonas abietaniphila]|uniref:Uncharacterized protein n=1 Tax=Pseudomonas abietaniphila TaxID=89065 RepID=A0A1G8KCQ7_9PSED|nr:hypothetical protein [Pseudomonas abietaniphila]SDI41207.1 hypothetical protein SAMN05216605_11352 [Pseudomonas abietaniphila]
MRGLILTLLLLVFVASVYADQPQQVIDVQHDAHRQVTCWIIPGTGISCLPDGQLRQPNVTQDHNKERPAPASVPTQRQDEEVFQL